MHEQPNDPTSAINAPTSPAAVEGVPLERPATPPPTKAAQITKLLARPRGATLAELTELTGWQPHTLRAHLTRLRQRGTTLERIDRKSGPAAYHAPRPAPVATSAATLPSTVVEPSHD